MVIKWYFFDKIRNILFEEDDEIDESFLNVMKEWMKKKILYKMPI